MYGIALLIISIAFVEVGFSTELDRQVTNPTASEGEANFAFSDSDNLTTDHHTWGKMQTGYTMSGQDSESIRIIRYDEEIVRMIFQKDPPPSHLPPLLVVNIQELDQPLYTDGEWSRFQPIKRIYNNKRPIRYKYGL